ncbi:hypothetical protein TTHERM_001081803 (macronuclear) [Tetrahymena thermophila SB210]|uniref:Uncharacterized protein n=1 Tax=Tetrahymena thermophila (strain SB210) TaxID=312017 RepID=W7XHX8_TETTS|nr:hypothetical protein TTHERM_001081803 [Tetrahymena thermophila SB210]EWS74156.1 hypothetical protein TTHERM_001081803 [Tetrahymena thermophila SB210]|eukprot:XP_012653316.1 hypothetical protein TTHERM_001081803 [Tetrahymena thermophila SB210]
MYGGAIASDNKLDSKFQNIQLTFSSFMNNQALIGSVLFQMQNLPISRIFQNTLLNNFAKLYGNQLEQSAVGFIGILNGQKYNSKIVIYNFLSGIIQDDLLIQLINAENYPISQLKNDIILKLETDQEDFSIFPSQIKQNNGLFNLSNLSIYGKLGSQLKIRLTSDFNYIPNYDLQGNFLNISQNIYFEIHFQFRKLCPKGTTLVQDNSKKDMCYNCPAGTFNLVDGQNCIKCPFVCQNSIMYLPRGYWRYSLTTYEYQECYLSQNCVGDIDKIVSQKLQGSTNRYCSEGNIGVFCMDCDIEGIYWENRYQQITPYTCQTNQIKEIKKVHKSFGNQQNKEFIANSRIFQLNITRKNKRNKQLKATQVTRNLQLSLTCNANQCYAVKLKGCSNILPDYTGTDTQGNCTSDREKSNILYCAKNSNNVCMDSSKTMCILLNSDPTDTYVGSYLNSNQILICIQLTDIQLTQITPTRIQFLKDGYCYKNDNLIYQGQQLKTSYMCQCPQNQCFNGTKCIQMDKNINAGLNLNGQCVKLSVIDNIQSCFNDGLSICLLTITQNTSKCIVYNQNTDIIGVYSYQNVNYCLSKSQVNQTIIINNIINLNSTYCYYHNQFVQIPNQTLQIIGITSRYNCFLLNSTVNQSDPLKSCIKGYCISQQKCIQMNSYNLISKRQDQTCGGNSEQNFLECFTSNTSKTTCINGNSCELILQSNNFVGAQANFDCVKANQQVNSDQGQTIMYCDQYYCIQQYQIDVLVSSGRHGDVYRTVTVQSCFVMNWFKKDSSGYCIYQGLQNICPNDNQCLTYDSDLQNYICVSLSTDITNPNFAKEKKTSKCLPYQPITGQAQNIDKCPAGYCIYMLSQSQKYCVALGSFVYGNQYIGVEQYTQLCLQQLDLSYIGISWCYGDNCVFKYQNYYVCHPLQYQSTYFSTNLSVKAKLQDGTCADLNQTVSVNCLAGDYCILNGACIPLDSNNQLAVGRSLQDQTCLPQNTMPATNCAQNYCLKNNQCYPLSLQNPARESQTGICIQANDPGMFGASSCYIDYCLFLGTSQNQNMCLPIDYQQQNQLGKYQGTGICVSQNDQSIPHTTQMIQLCFKGVYCIATNSNGDYCQKVEGIYKCSDSQGKCVLQTDSTTPCSRCSFNECLLNGNCVSLDNKYCQDNNGNCLDVSQSGCKIKIIYVKIQKQQMKLNNAQSAQNIFLTLEMILAISKLSISKIAILIYNFNTSWKTATLTLIVPLIVKNVQKVLPDGKFTNKKYYNFGNYQAQNVLGYCLRCQPGYKRAANRFDCAQIVQDSQPNCYDYDIISSINFKSTKTFLNYQYQTGETSIFNCNYCSPSTCLSPYYRACIDLGDPTNLNSTSIICNSQSTQNLKVVGGDYQYNNCQYLYPLIITAEFNLYCDSNRHCDQLIQNCLNCYEFQHYQDGLLFQCIQCKEGFIPSISGCIPCPKGCLNCYEIGYYQQQKVNFTNILIYERRMLKDMTLQQRIDYSNLYQIQMLCSVCDSGRVLSATQLSCDYVVCGKYCQKCMYYQDQPLCVQCNTNLLFAEITSIQMYIAQMYFNSIFLDQIDLMISFDQNQQNCKLCPMLCETCQDKSNYFLNGAYDLYDTKCYSCKQKIPNSQPELERYEIRYDKQRMKCQLCLKNDNGCYFKKQSHVYVFCGSYNQTLGSGTETDPYNLFKISQINVDSLILNEADVNRAYLYYNELQLRELELIIQYVDQGGVCVENVALNLQTNLKSTISSLEFMTLTIKADQSKDYQTFFTVKQIAVAQISGFSQIQVQNLNIVSKYINGYFGYQSQNTTINQIQFQNVTFSTQSQVPNLLWLSFEYFNGTLIIDNVSFNNITIQNRITKFVQSLNKLKQLLIEINTYIGFSAYFKNIFSFQFSKAQHKQLQFLQQLYNSLCSKFQSNNNKQARVIQQQNSIRYKQYLTVLQLILFRLAIQYDSNLQAYNFTSFEIHSNLVDCNQAIIFQLSKSINAVVNITDFQIESNKYNILQNVEQQNNKFFQFSSITSLVINNLSIQDDNVVQFLTIQSIQHVDINILNVGQLARQSSAYNIFSFQAVNSTCIIKNVVLIQLTTYQQLILIHQIMNQINDRDQYNIKLLNFTLNEIEMIRIPPISLEIPMQNIIEIQSKIDGNVLISNFQGTNIYRKFNKTQEYQITELYQSTVILIQMQIGYLQIENSLIQSYYVHPQHNLLQISCYQIQLVNSSFVLQENQNKKLTLDDSTLKGGILNLFASQVQIFNTTFLGGLAMQGGAIYFQSLQQTKVYIQQSNFIDNWSFNLKNQQECFGGAIYFDISLIKNTVEFFVLNTKFQNNLSLNQGGAIYISNSLLKYFFISQYNNFIDNLSLKGSNIYSFQSKAISQITMYITVVSITDNFYILSQNLQPYFSQQMIESASISLFSFQNYYSVDVIQCIFQSSQPNNQLNEINLAMLSYQAIMNFKSITLLTLDQNKYNQFQVYSNLINISNSLKVLIQWDFFDNNQLAANPLIYHQNTQIKSFISINSNSVIIKKLTFQNNNCSLCDQGNILIDSSHLLIYQSIFKGNTALNGGSLYLQMTIQTSNNRILQHSNIDDYLILFSQANQTILNCTFIENTALQSGGSIFIENTLIYLSNLFFIGNKAKMYGGALASDNSSGNTFQNIQLASSTFLNNQALIGSVFFQMQNLPIQKMFQNTLKNNFAKLYGNQLQQSAVGFIGILNGKSYNSKIIIKNFLSGVIKVQIYLQQIYFKNKFLLYFIK